LDSVAEIVKSLHAMMIITATIRFSARNWKPVCITWACLPKGTRPTIRRFRIQVTVVNRVAITT